jgi:hypothetical protein
MSLQRGISLQQYSIVAHNQYSISHETYDIGSATGIGLSNRDRQRVTVNGTLLSGRTKEITKVTRRPEINSASANFKKLKNNCIYYYYY